MPDLRLHRLGGSIAAVATLGGPAPLAPIGSPSGTRAAVRAASTPVRCHDDSVGGGGDNEGAVHSPTSRRTAISKGRRTRRGRTQAPACPSRSFLRGRAMGHRSGTWSSWPRRRARNLAAITSPAPPPTARLFASAAQTNAVPSGCGTFEYLLRTSSCGGRRADVRGVIQRHWRRRRRPTARSSC